MYRQQKLGAPLPRFPAEVCGVDTLHAPFLNERRTRGPLQHGVVGNRGQAFFWLEWDTTALSLRLSIHSTPSMEEDGCPSPQRTWAEKYGRCPPNALNFLPGALFGKVFTIPCLKPAPGFHHPSHRLFRRVRGRRQVAHLSPRARGMLLVQVQTDLRNSQRLGEMRFSLDS